MTFWSQITSEEYHQLDLRAHDLLADVPVHDVWSVFLPGEDRACTMAEIRAIVQATSTSQTPNIPVRLLFALRRLLGKLFGWDKAPKQPGSWSFRTRLTDSDRQASLVPPGTRDGPFQVLYVHTQEAVSEIRNATVQAYLVLAVQPRPDGHQLYLAVHVLPVSGWTNVYMALISPFRRFIVYPSLMRQFHTMWTDGAESVASEA